MSRDRLHLALLIAGFYAVHLLWIAIATGVVVLTVRWLW